MLPAQMRKRQGKLEKKPYLKIKNIIPTGSTKGRALKGSLFTGKKGETKTSMVVVIKEREDCLIITNDYKKWYN